jgi:hypothetical protein
MIRASQYEFERRKYAQDLIAFDKTFSALFSEKLRVDSEGHGPTREEFIGLAFPLLLASTDIFHYLSITQSFPKLRKLLIWRWCTICAFHAHQHDASTRGVKPHHRTTPSPAHTRARC